MPTYIPISDPADPRLSAFADLRDPSRNADELAGRRDTFIAEGEFVVRVLARSPFSIRSLVACPSRIEAMREVLETLPSSVPVYELAERALQELVGYQFHRGVLACGERPAARPLVETLADARALVILENLTNVDNVGGAFRNTAALVGAGGAVLLNPTCADPLYRKAIRVSMGHVFRVPFARVTPWPDGLDTIRAAGFTLIALTPDPSAVDIRTLDPDRVRRPALLLGAEGPGLTDAAFGRADLRVRIPIGAGVDSLNVGVAGAVALSRLVTPL